jgi:putative ABC transport system substrate-binding protein
MLGAGAWPLPGCAQAAEMPVIGFLNIGSAHAFGSFLAAFHQGLNFAGYVENRNIAISYRWADGDFKLLREQAVDLVRSHVALIVATGGMVVARAARDATNSIPIIFIGGGYPVEEGLVASLNRPGGNATGINLLATELIPKRLELLRDLVPKTSKYGALLNPMTPASAFEKADLENTSRKLGWPISILSASTESELEQSFAVAAMQVEALVVSNDGFFTSRRRKIIELAAKYKLPVIYGNREYVLDGGLISYGPRISDAYRRIGDYVGRVLKGAKPSDLPVQQPTTFDLALNLKTARALGLDVNQVLITATEVIE